MFKYACLNNISEKGLEKFTPDYERSDDPAQAQGLLVRSASMHDMEFSPELLAIARAAIADPPVLILDEATSSIDTRTEKIVQDGMDKLMNGRTTFVIAHRLSTIKNSDTILVLEQGRIVERGNHEQLLALKGRYYQLYTGKSDSLTA